MEKIISLPWQKIKEEPLDITLAKKAKNGDSDAFTELYKIHKIYLYKIAYSYVKDENKALDIMQECAYKGFFYIHKLKNPNIFKTWITRVLINVAIDYLKKESKIIYLDNDSSIACDEKDISLEEKMDLYNAIDTLKDKYKTVIILRYFNNMSIDDIAKTMEIPSNTVKSHLRRAKESLERAKERMRQKQSIREYYMSQASMARALARLQFKDKHIN